MINDIKSLRLDMTAETHPVAEGIIVTNNGPVASVAVHWTQKSRNINKGRANAAIEFK